VRSALVAALVSCADTRLRSRARRFLHGLSSDELQFIAEFLGACILESAQRYGCSRGQIAARIAEFQQAGRGYSYRSPDRDHKMILLLEFLCRSNSQEGSLPMRAGQAG
jgi:hypothetical protein